MLIVNKFNSLINKTSFNSVSIGNLLCACLGLAWDIVILIYQVVHRPTPVILLLLGLQGVNLLYVLDFILLEYLALLLPVLDLSAELLETSRKGLGAASTLSHGG